MLAEERKKIICELVNRKKGVRVTELSKQLGITEATVRRDLEELQNDKKLRRTHGGALPLYSASKNYIISELSGVNTEAKVKIAKKAYEFIDDNDTIMIDNSSTVMELARLLAEKPKNGITVITNSFYMVDILLCKDEIHLIHIGGEVRKHSNSTVGLITEQAIRNLRADKCFIGSNGIDVNYGYSITNFEEAGVKCSMLASSKQKFVLADHSKFGDSYLAKFADIDGDVDFLISDRKAEGFDYNKIEDKLMFLLADAD